MMRAASVNLFVGFLKMVQAVSNSGVCLGTPTALTTLGKFVNILF